jgi:hypothetical protein
LLAVITASHVLFGLDRQRRLLAESPIYVIAVH